MQVNILENIETIVRYTVHNQNVAAKTSHPKAPFTACPALDLLGQRRSVAETRWKAKCAQ